MGEGWDGGDARKRGYGAYSEFRRKHTEALYRGRDPMGASRASTPRAISAAPIALADKSGASANIRIPAFAGMTGGGKSGIAA